MNFMTGGKACTLRRFIQANMALGLVVLVAAVYMIITGNYESYHARQAAETVLNRTAIGALLYLVGFWFAAIFSKPFLATACAQQS